jgi:hypothetical protein
MGLRALIRDYPYHLLAAAVVAGIVVAGIVRGLL